MSEEQIMLKLEMHLISFCQDNRMEHELNAWVFEIYFFQSLWPHKSKIIEDIAIWF